MITFEEIRADRYSLREVEGVEGIYKVYIPENIPFQLNKTTTAIEYDKKMVESLYMIPMRISSVCCINGN